MKNLITQEMEPECVKLLDIVVAPNYKYARESAFSNQGEDVKGSARHNYHEWKGIADAEEVGGEVARGMITRDKLIKNLPPQIEIKEENIIASSVAVTLVKRMPSEPEYLPAIATDRPMYALCKKGSIGNDIILSVSESEARLERLSKDHAETHVVKLGETVDEVNKKIRQAYFEKYDWIKKAAEEFSKKESLKGVHLIEDETSRIGLIIRETKPLLDSFDNEFGAKAGGYITMSTGDCNFTKRYLSIYPSIRRNKKYSVGDSVMSTLHSIREGKMVETINFLKKAVSGGSLGLGDKKGKKGERFNPIVFYSQELKRVGPAVLQKTKEEMENAISSSGLYKLRGLQWGQTVSDKERMEHLKNICESLNDLKDTLSISDSQISFGGKLAIAVGARGKSSALAHFERATSAINLTRKNGIGALAHEWGHALEYNMYNSKDFGGFSESLGTIPLNGRFTYENIHNSNKAHGKDPYFALAQEDFTGKLKIFYDRMKGSKKFKEMPTNHKKYLIEPAELFARTFEAMIKRKMEKKGRVNTYLVSCSDPDVYPSNDELDSMESSFDIIVKRLLPA